jgi:rhodanese-related sulfurtransferase
MNIKNIFKKLYKRKDDKDITIKELEEMIDKLENVILLDVRSIQEYEEGHLDNSINLPLHEIEVNAKDIIPDVNSIIIVYCQVGVRSKKAIEILKKKGYANLYHLENGLDGI